MKNKFIQKKVAHLCEAYEIPGLSYMAVCNGTVEAIGSTGIASIPFNVPVTNHTLFHIGSVGKHFTGVALLRLVARGLVDIESPIGNYLKHIPPHWADRTIRCLTNHTSGLPNYTEYILDDRNMSNTDVYAAIASEPLRFPQGQRFDYSNTNYRLIGDIIEVISKQTYAQHMTKEIFKLASFDETIIDNSNCLIKNHAEPYTLTKHGLERATNYYMINLGSADGGIAMSARDAVKWDIALWGGSLLSTDSLQQMIEPTMLNSGCQFPYAVGWFLDKINNSRLVWHGGTMPGFKAHYLHVLKGNLSVFVMSNLPQSFAAEKHIAEMIAEHILPGSSPMSLIPINDDDAEATNLAYTIVFRKNKRLPYNSLIKELRTTSNCTSSIMQLLDISKNGAPDSFNLIEQTVTEKGRKRRYRAIWGARIEHITVSHQAGDLIDRVARF